MNNQETGSTQFSDPRLVAAYDSLNALGDDSEFFCQQAAQLSAKTIIDLGCGTGILTCELAKRGHTMIGIEPSGAMLVVAKTKPYADQVKWVEGGYEKFEGLKADMVLMTSHVAQFFLKDKEWEAMLKAAYKALNPNGYIVFDIRVLDNPPFKKWPTAESPKRIEDPKMGPIDWWFKLLEVKENIVKYELHYVFIDSGEEVISTDELVFLSKEEITKSLVNAGFSVEKIYGNWDNSLLTENSPEMIFIAKRK